MATPRKRSTPAPPAPADAPATLAFDIGGTGLKAAVLDRSGAMLSKRVRVPTPHPAPPQAVVDALVKLAAPLPAYGRISIGFPGVVRRGKVLTAPHFGNEAWHNFPLAEEIASRLGHSARLLNDAEVQGYGVIQGKGLEFVITLGTGVGSALFRDGALMPHMEFAQFPFRKKPTMNDYVGDAARHEHSKSKWNKRVGRILTAFETLINFDTMYIGGGNASHIDLELPKNIHIVSNDAGLTGGIRLWDHPVQ